MHIFWAAVVLLSMVFIMAALYFLYNLAAQQGRILLRLEALEQRLNQRFVTENAFEYEHIYQSVVLHDEYKILGRRFEPEDVIVDVGAHIGAFTYLCHKQGSRAIHAFEPSQRNFELLQRNAGPLPGVQVERKAVWRSDRPPATLVLSGPDRDNTGACTVLAAGRLVDFAQQDFIESSGSAASVPTVALDEILRRFDRVKILKFDCEGSEFPILLTSRELGRVREIVAEVHEFDEAVVAKLDPESVVRDAYRVEILVEHLQSLGFVVLARPTAGKHQFLLNAVRELGQA